MKGQSKWNSRRLVGVQGDTDDNILTKGRIAAMEGIHMETDKSPQRQSGYSVLGHLVALENERFRSTGSEPFQELLITYQTRDYF